MTLVRRPALPTTPAATSTQLEVSTARDRWSEAARVSLQRVLTFLPLSSSARVPVLVRDSVLFPYQGGDVDEREVFAAFHNASTIERRPLIALVAFAPDDEENASATSAAHDRGTRGDDDPQDEDDVLVGTLARVDASSAESNAANKVRLEGICRIAFETMPRTRREVVRAFKLPLVPNDDDELSLDIRSAAAELVRVLELADARETKLISEHLPPAQLAYFIASICNLDVATQLRVLEIEHERVLLEASVNVAREIVDEVRKKASTA